jgi:hypothetical protein
MQKNIVVIGSINQDIIMKVSRMPKLGESMVVDECIMAAGGKGCNQAVQAAKLGESVSIIGAVGKDAMGAFLLDEAKKYRVDVSHVKQSKETTGMAIAHVLTDGSLICSVSRGANFDLHKREVDEAESLLRSAAIVILQNEVPEEVDYYIIEKAQEWNYKVIYNAAPARAMKRSFIAECDVVVVNEVEAEFYCGKTIDQIDIAKEEALKLSQDMGNSWIFTLGSMGSVVASNNTVLFVPSYKVKAIESLGAGDSYVGALSHALLKGKDIFEGARFATACSALTVLKCGAQIAMPTLEEVDEFRKSHSLEEVSL